MVKEKDEVLEFIEKFHETSQDMEVMTGELKKAANNLLIFGEGGFLAGLSPESKHTVCLALQTFYKSSIELTEAFKRVIEGIELYIKTEQLKEG